jgi:hypothetical protein
MTSASHTSGSAHSAQSLQREQVHRCPAGPCSEGCARADRGAGKLKCHSALWGSMAKLQLYALAALLPFPKAPSRVWRSEHARCGPELPRRATASRHWLRCPARSRGAFRCGGTCPRPPSASYRKTALTHRWATGPRQTPGDMERAAD